jgi:hypothetical protein
MELRVAHHTEGRFPFEPHLQHLKYQTGMFNRGAISTF